MSSAPNNGGIKIRPTKEIDDPTWDDVTQRDALIRWLCAIMAGEGRMNHAATQAMDAIDGPVGGNDIDGSADGNVLGPGDWCGGGPGE